jgi:hypothetical protein
MYIEPLQSGPYGVPPFGLWHQTQKPPMKYSVVSTIIGGVPVGGGASSEDLHPFVLLDGGGGVVHERTIWETPAAWAGATGSKPRTATIGSPMANFLALTRTRKLLHLHP